MKRKVLPEKLKVKKNVENYLSVLKYVIKQYIICRMCKQHFRGGAHFK